MNSTSERLQEIQQHGFNFDLKITLTQAFENYKKIAFKIGTLLLVLIILFTFLLGSVAGITFGITDMMKFFTNFDISSYWILVIILEFLVKLTGTALVAPLIAGFLNMAHEADNNRPLVFSTAFHYYKSSYFKKLFKAALIIAFIANGIDALLNFMIVYFDNKLFNLFCSQIIIIFYGLSGMFALITFSLIIFGNLSVSDSIKGAILIVREKIWKFLALTLLLLSIPLITIFFLMIIEGIGYVTLGLMILCIAMFFALPFVYSLQYIIYKNVIGIENEKKTF